VSAANALKQACRNGHPYSKANTRVTPNGWRSCRMCNVLRLRLRRQREAAGTAIWK